MVNIDAIEKALLIGVVREKSWQTLILNNITEDHFSYANRRLYHYIKDQVDINKYPELPILGFEFQIDDISMSEYSSMTDLDGLCGALKSEYTKSQLNKQLVQLNEHSEEVNVDPVSYIQRIGNVYNELKLIGMTNKSVGLFDNIEEILKLDPSNVISTGFDELDRALVGWQRGEEMVVFMARTGQGKSWARIKVCFSSSI